MSITITSNKPGKRNQVLTLRAIFSNKTLQWLFCVCFSGLTPAALAIAAQQPPVVETSANHPADKSATALVTNTSMTAATVRKIDPTQANITLKHAAIANIGMPAMTMVFKVADPKLLIGLDVNDEVHFSVEKQGSTLVVTAIEKQIATTME